MKRLSFIRSVAVLVCVLGLGAVTNGQDYNITSDDLFGDEPTPASSSGGDGTFQGSGNSSGNFDDATIQNLFGTYDASEPSKKDDAAPARVLPPFHGNYKVLVSRPIYAVYEAEAKTKWISATAEIYTHYKVASFPRTHVFTMEQVDGVLPNSRDFSRKFNRQHFIDAAKKLGATHLLYQEYQPHKNGKEAQFVMDLYWLAEGASVVRVAQGVIFSAYEQGLDRCLAKIAEAMDPGASKTTAYGQTVWGKDLKLLEGFGNILAGEGQFTSERASATYTAAEKGFIAKQSNNLGVQFASALLAGRAGHYDRAVNHLNNVIGKSGDHPALQLYLADFLRGAGRYSEAEKAAETAGRKPALKNPAAIELAAIYAAQGDLGRARSEYASVEQSGEADGRVYFRLALLSIQSGNIPESEEYLNRAKESGLSLDESESIEIGIAYGKADGYEERAIEMLKQGMGVKQNNEMAWSAIADIYKKMGNRQLEAETYINLFKINPNAHSGKLKTAGEAYEELGMTEKAKDAYSLFIDRRFSNPDVAMNLARIYFNEKNCRKLPDVLKGYDTIPEAAQMLNECGFSTRKIKAEHTLQKKKLSPLMFSLRYGGLAIMAGGTVGGIVCNSIADTEMKRYNEWKDDLESDATKPSEVKKMRETIDSNVLMRNVLYGVAAVGLSAFAVTWFF